MGGCFEQSKHLSHDDKKQNKETTMISFDLLATLQPNFAHFPKFANDSQLAGVRLNNPHWTPDELRAELDLASNATVPLYFDVKGWQLRVIKVHPNDQYLDIELNHPIRVPTPTTVIFKAGGDSARLLRIEEDGRRLIFDLGSATGPRYRVKEGESLQIRNPALEVLGQQFTEQEIEKIQVAKTAGISRYFLSYVSCADDVRRFRELVGEDAEVLLKIESKQGLQFVSSSYRKTDNTRLVAARGDLYVEVDRPHDIVSALQLIIEKDPDAMIGSRFMLSVIHEPVPSCADFLELAWVYDQGYRSIMLCDELCLKHDLLTTAINACQSFKDEYTPTARSIGTTEDLNAKNLWERARQLVGFGNSRRAST
jgi:pyruvate kinase